MEFHNVLRENRQRSKMQSSPLMFESDDETEAVNDSANSSNKENGEESIDCVPEPSKEERILKGLQTVLMGIPPPPAFTVPQFDCREILKLWRENQSFRVTFSPKKYENNRDESKKLEEKARNTNWPDLLHLDYWDVYYNKNSASEELERLSIRYKERYVGAETSSCINALFAKSPHRTASARKRARSRAWGHSPGRRLSHLARRRKAFSSASLCSVAGNNNPDKKMIMVEIKKIGSRKFGQKKKGSVKKTKPTPKKKSENPPNTIKRALFQSPDQDPINAASKTPNTQCIQRSKRNLFADSSEKKNEFGKRERPVPRRVSPRKRVNRSLSFQESSQPCTPPPPPAPAPATTHSQPQPALSGAHKQKMLWAVTHALREEGMGMSHELFRPCMTVLFRTCQRLWPAQATRDAAPPASSTSERMLALAKRFSSYTIREISSDPTSEHMALVYNNSLKMAESMLNQPSTSGIQSMNTREIVTNSVSGGRTTKKPSDNGKQKRNETEKNIARTDNRSNSNNAYNMILVGVVDSSADTKNKNISENKTKTPCKNKNVSKKSFEVSCVAIEKDTNLTKRTPSKVSIRDSPRSSPRLASKTNSGVKVGSSVCNDLFAFKTNDQSCERAHSQINSSLCMQKLNKDSVLTDKRKNEIISSPLMGKLDLDHLSKNVDESLREIPLKTLLLSHLKHLKCVESSSVRESSKRSPTTRTLCELNGLDFAGCTYSSPGRYNEELSNSANGKNSPERNDKIVEPNNLDEKFQYEIINKCVDNPEGCLQTVRSSPRNKQTPAKKVTFSSESPTKSCYVRLSRPSSSSKRECILSPPVSCQNHNELSDSLTSKISDIIKTTSNVNFHVAEIFKGKRITRSISTDTKVVNKQPVHHLFSPPTILSNNTSRKEVSKDFVCSSELKMSETPLTAPNFINGRELPNEKRRVTRNISKGFKIIKSPVLLSSNEDPTITLPNPSCDHNKSEDSDDSELSKRCLRSTKSPKKKNLNRRISQDAVSTKSSDSSVSTSSSQNYTVGMNSPDFVSPRTRSKSKSNKITKADSSDISPTIVASDKSASSTDFLSPVIQLKRATTVNKRLSIVSSDKSPCKTTPDKSNFSEEHSADYESGTLIHQSDESFGGRSNNLVEVECDDNETNKENLGEKSSEGGCSDKNVVSNKHISHGHLSSVENTPTNKVIPEEPVSRMLQLYRLSTSGGNDSEKEKLLPEIVCLEPPELIPHWARNEYESDKSISPEKSPPSLTPHWEESCSGTSTSLPESIMAHWQQLSARATGEPMTSDKVMFDFEDTSYEITFPTNEDSRNSSICAPFDFPLLIDDSKSCFNSVFRRNGDESTDK